jgi:uncharacterized membrane protein
MLAAAHRFHHIHPFVRLIFLLLVVVAIVVGVVALIRSRRNRRGPVPEPAWPRRDPGSDPVNTELRAAYARGDITWAEYSQRAANLGYLVPPVPPPPAGGPPSDP